MFTLITGKPGSSKTSHIIDLIHFDPKYKDRPVYYRGIKGLTLPWHELTDEQTLNWPEHVPDGAILVVDEAQELWRVRAPSKEVPPGLIALEKHRHRGLDIWFLSQDPSLLDKHARTIANEHKHYSRPFGAPFANEYYSGSGYVNPENSSELAKCIMERRRLPKRVWGLYHSAEKHTHKFRPPKLMFILPLLALGVAFLVWRFVSTYGDDHPHNQVKEVQTDGQQGGSIAAAQRQEAKTWGELLKPEIPDLPWTAPIYRGRAMVVKDVPRLAGCMLSKTRGCRCYTQQGTVLNVRESVCRNHVKYGHFDHMLGSDDQKKLEASSS